MVVTSILSLCGEAFVAYRIRKVSAYSVDDTALTVLQAYFERPWRVVEVPSETHRMYRVGAGSA